MNENIVKLQAWAFCLCVVVSLRSYIPEQPWLLSQLFCFRPEHSVCVLYCSYTAIFRNSRDYYLNCFASGLSILSVCCIVLTQLYSGTAVIIISTVLLQAWAFCLYVVLSLRSYIPEQPWLLSQLFCFRPEHSVCVLYCSYTAIFRNSRNYYLNCCSWSLWTINFR